MVPDVSPSDPSSSVPSASPSGHGHDATLSCTLCRSVASATPPPTAATADGAPEPSDGFGIVRKSSAGRHDSSA